VNNKNKIVYLMGGIGNVLFQINFGYYLKKIGYNVVYDITLLRPSSITKFLKWSDHNTLSLINEIGLNKKIKLITTSKINILFLFLSKFFKKRFFHYSYIGIESDLSDLENIKYFSGYFHTNIEISNTLVHELRELIKVYIKNNSELEKNIYILQKSRSMHYRGGDYLKDDFRKIDDKFYYYVFKNYIPDYIISNDRQSAVLYLSEFTSEKIKIINGKNALDDFILMAYSDELIISNSTFSWWASEVGYTNKIIQPEPLFSHVDWNVDTHKKRIRYSIEDYSYES
jgi:hypothetical protein